MSSHAVRRHVGARRSSPTGAILLVALALALPLLLGGCAGTSLGGITPSLEDDSPLARRVSEALAERPELARFGIKVKSLDEDTVRLSGRVDSDMARSAAGQAAAAVPGVRSVINTIYLDF